MSNTFLYAGTSIYSNTLGIYIFEINDSNGSLSLVDTASDLVNPSYQQIYPKKQLLFSTGQITKDAAIGNAVIASYRIDKKSGSLELINTVSVGNRAPCHISVNSDCSYLFSANYSEATIHVIPVNPGGELGNPICKVERSGSGINKERQDTAHAHYASLTPDEKYLCVADLGTDEVAVYDFDEKTGTLMHNPDMTIKTAPGSGPRHLIFHPSGNYMYLVNELSSNIMTYSYFVNKFEHLQTISTLPGGYTGHSQCAAIKLTDDASLLFASNRGHDSIAGFKIKEDGTLVFMGTSEVLGRHPRDFSISSDGKYLYCANMHSGNITVFEIIPGKLPCFTGCSIDVPAPACISFFNF